MLCHMEIEHAKNVIRRAVGSLDRNHDPWIQKSRREASLLDTTEVSTLYLYPEEASMG